MPHAVDEELEVVALLEDLRRISELGAEVKLPPSQTLLRVDLLSESDKSTLREGLFDHGVLVIREQTGVDPNQLVALAKVFDENVKDVHSGGAKQITDPKNILSQNGCSRIPRAPQVTVIGQGKVEGHEEIPQLELKHLDHTTFHEEPASQEEVQDGVTRPYRWHMDAPVYENFPGFGTSLHAIDVPDVPDQKLVFPNGEVQNIAAGATAFFSGARNFDLLSPEEQEFAINTTVHYAPRAYEWIKDCKATSDGLSIAHVGREKAEEDLPEFSWEKVHSYPMVWRNVSNGKPHLQILGCVVKSLSTKDPSTGEVTRVDDVAEVRRICHSFQKKAYTPGNVYAHRWRPGDLVIFHNRGVMHSITGQLAQSSQRRLMWQCSMASNSAPEAFVKAA